MEWKPITEAAVGRYASSAKENFKKGKTEEGIKDALTALGALAVRVAGEFIKRR